MVEWLSEFIWNEARNYLLSFHNVDEEIITQHTGLYEVKKSESMSDLYRGLIKSLPNRQGMSNWIGNIEDFRSILFNFNPIQVSKVYKDWRIFFRIIKDSGLRPSAKMDINDSRNAWVHFSKGVIDGGIFLSGFSSVKEFNDFVDRFLSQNRHIELARFLQRKIHGYGFALACDFLKENGYPDFVKPDTHIIDIFCELGLARSDRQIDVFNAVIDFSNEVKESPYVVDKLFWLIGSGYFYLIDNMPKVNVNKFDFCNGVKKKLAKIGVTISATVRTNAKEKFKKVDEERKRQFKVFIELLNKVRGKSIITAKEMRDIKKRWIENKEDRAYLYNWLKETLSNSVQKGI